MRSPFTFALLLVSLVLFAFSYRAYGQASTNAGIADAGVFDSAVYDASVPGPTSSGVAPAATPAPSDGIAFFKAIVNAAKSANWFWLVTLGLSGIVWVLRLPALIGRIKWFTTKNGGRTLTLLVSVVGLLVAAFGAAGNFKAIQWSVLVLALGHAALAAFGYDWSRSALGISKTTPPAGA